MRKRLSDVFAQVGTSEEFFSTCHVESEVIFEKKKKERENELTTVKVEISRFKIRPDGFSREFPPRSYVSLNYRQFLVVTCALSLQNKITFANLCTLGLVGMYNFDVPIVLLVIWVNYHVVRGISKCPNTREHGYVHRRSEISWQVLYSYNKSSTT